MLPPVCILAGGLGTRLGEHVRDTPKPLLEVAGKPFLHHQLELLATHGARQVVLCVGYLGELIEQRIGRDCCGIQISYAHDSPELDGTLGAIRGARHLLPQRFLVLYGDTYLQLDYGAAARGWQQSGTQGLMCVLRNDGRWDSSNVSFAGDRVLAYDKRMSRREMKWIDYGLGGLDARALDVLPEERDLSALQAVLASRGELFGYEVSERFYEIGTTEALAATDAYLRGLADAPPNQGDVSEAATGDHRGPT